MSIDAKIRNVEETPEGLLLHLEPRREDTGWSLMGQRRLLIEQPTWKPEYGMRVWGGDDRVIIVPAPGEEKHYKRQGYTRLKEDFNKGDKTVETTKITIDNLPDLYTLLSSGLPEDVASDIPNGDLFSGNFTVVHFTNKDVTIEVTYTGDAEV